MTYENQYEDIQSIQSLEMTGRDIVGYKPEYEQAYELELNAFIKERLELRSDLLNHDRGSYNSPEFRSKYKINVDKVLASKKEIIHNALKKVAEKIDAQIVALFLFSKDGVLERVGIFGEDFHRNPITDEWYSTESYRAGESFTGKAASYGGKKYGDILYARNLGKLDLKEESRTKYLDKLGNSPLQCAIAIPLNGRNKTFGVLRIINKIDKPRSESSPVLVSFSDDDVEWAVFLATYIANSLSNFRRDIQIKIFQQVSYFLIDSHMQSNQTSFFCEAYQEIIDLLVKNPETAFKAGVIRVVDRSLKTLVFAAESLAENVTSRDDKEPISFNSNRLVAEVVQSCEPSVLNGIRGFQEIDKFTNKDWILENKLDAFGCFPIVYKGESVGTLSLYTGYDYHFYPDSLLFIQSIIDLLAAFIHKTQLEEMERDAKLLNQMRNNSTVQVPGSRTIAIKPPRKLFVAIETEVLSRLDDQPLNIKELSEKLDCLEDEMAEIVKRLLDSRKIDYFGKSILYYIFPEWNRRMKEKQNLNTGNPACKFTLTSRGYFQLHPVFSSSK
jgi:GAF domain-containing protein